MIKKRLLVLAEYPIVNPLHGGQKRTEALYKFYKTVFQDVLFVGVYHRGFYSEHGESDVLLGQLDVIQSIDTNPFAAELITGDAIDKDIHVRSNVAKILIDFKPDIIHVEQPFLYSGLSVLLNELNIKSGLIFGSQNIEYRMKEQIYKNIGTPKHLSKKLINETKNLEQKFSKEANLVIAVSEADAKIHKNMGAENVIVIPNGIKRHTVSKVGKIYVDKVKKDNNISNIITFVGSRHPPNWVGFISMVGEDTTFLPNDTKIMIAGGVSEYFKTTYDYKKRSTNNKNFWIGILPLGFLEEDQLTGLIYKTDIIILPITSGGGSNLKTAEAILSGKKIVATNYAFRGFEEYLRLPNIYIADEPEKFKNCIIEALKAKYIKRTPEEVRLSERVQWDKCLLPIKRAVKRILRKNFREYIKIVKRKTLSVIRALRSLPRPFN